MDTEASIRSPLAVAGDVALVAHQLRTPLTAIKAAGELLRDAPPGDTDRFVDVIDRNADRLQAMVDDLMLLAELERQDRSNGPAADLSDVAARVGTHCADRLTEHGLALEVDVPVGPRVAMAGSDLEWALRRAVDGVAAASARGGRITLSAGVTGGQWAVDCFGGPPGIREDESGRVFDPFFRPAGARRAAEGLGPAVTAALVRCCRGDVRYRRLDGSRWSLQLMLPLAAGA